MFDFLLAPFSSELGIDLGTANTLVYVRGKGILIREPSVVAVHRKTGAVLAVGEEARRMVGKVPAHILPIRPLREGVISDFEVTEKMLRFFIRKVHEVPSRFPRILRSLVVIGIPSGITEVERRAVRDAALRAGAREVFLIEEPLAAAIGAGLPVEEPEGSLIVDIGGGTTEIAVISLGGIVIGKSLRVAGDRMSDAIAAYAREQHNLLLGEQTAEKIKIAVGNVYPEKVRGSKRQPDRSEQEGALMRGRDLVSGLPKAVKLTPDAAREALKPPTAAILSGVRDVIEATPPELLSDVLERGLTLVGGGSLLRRMDRLLAEEIGVPVKLVDDPMTCVVRGCGKALEDRELLEKVKVV